MVVEVWHLLNNELYMLWLDESKKGESLLFLGHSMDYEIRSYKVLKCGEER